jgi:hypothetical protein
MEFIKIIKDNFIKVSFLKINMTGLASYIKIKYLFIKEIGYKVKRLIWIMEQKIIILE